jgi:outer membrane immunogenic protein
MRRVAFGVLLFCLICVISAIGQQPGNGSGPQAQLSVGYMYQGSQVATDNSWFGLQGGRADFMVGSRHLGIVAEATGNHTDSIGSSSTGLTLYTFMGGPRFSIPVRSHRETRQLTLFVQSLYGVVHATSGMFPSGTTVKSTANNFAMSAGAGLQADLSRRISLRVIQADYLYTQLPNLSDNYQNNYRISAGIVLHLH